VEDSCFFCQESQVLHTHHIVPRRFDGSDDDENLVTVCPNCHSKLEDLYNKRFYKELAVALRTTDFWDGDFVCPLCGREFYVESEHREHVKQCFEGCEVSGQ